MAVLIDNVLDFARGRLGGGLPVERNEGESLDPVLEQVIAELRASWPERAIEASLAALSPVRCDAHRIAQLFSNLLANALAHGSAAGPVGVRAATTPGQFELSVTNPGKPIPPATLERLFLPFSRTSGKPGQQGLGLGLYIASEIARAHDGSIEVSSTATETRFTFRMPLS